MGARYAWLGAACAVSIALVAASPAAAGQTITYSHGGVLTSIDPDGSNRSTIAAPADPKRFEFSQPRWSPDRTALVFVRGSVDDEDNERAQLMLRDSSGTRALTPLSRTDLDFLPAWSPDGRALAFIRATQRGARLRYAVSVISRAGGAVRTVYSERFGARQNTLASPAWSPDGKRIAYTRYRLDRESTVVPSLYTVAAAGGKPKRFIREAEYARWSPDGTRLAYSSVRDRIEGPRGSDESTLAGEIYIARANGTGARRLTRNRGQETAPSWSADGSRLTFASDRNRPKSGRNEVYTVGVDGRCLTWLTNGTAISTDPDFGPGSGGAAPGRCGSAGRRPLVEVAPTRRQRGAFWLGSSYRGLLLTELEGPGDDTSAQYEDCGRWDPRKCPGDLTIGTDRTCRLRSLERDLRTLPGVRFGRIRGTAALLTTTTTILTGSRAVLVGRAFPGRQGVNSAVFNALRRVGLKSRARLAPPRMPQRTVRRLRRAAEVVRAEDGDRRAAARRLGLSVPRLRGRIALLRGLRLAGPLRSTPCGG